MEKDEIKIATLVLAGAIYKDLIAKGTPQGESPEVLAHHAFSYAQTFFDLGARIGLLPESTS